MKVNLPKIITSENSGVVSTDPLLFVLHQIDLKILNQGLTLTMKYFDSIMTGQLNLVTNNSRQSNELSDDDEPDLQQILIEEGYQCQLNQKRLLKLKQTKLNYNPKLRKVSVSDLLKEFNQCHTDSAGHPYSATVLVINEIYGMYILFFYFVLHNHLTDKGKPIRSTR